MTSRAFQQAACRSLQRSVRLRWLAPVVLVVMGISACGTTVPRANQGIAEGGPAGLGGDLAATTGATAPVATADGANPQNPTGAGAVPSVTTPSSGPTPVTSLPEPVSGSSGRGFTATTITLGVEYLDAAAGDTGALFGKNLTIGDPKEQAAAVISYLNARGGLFGRKIIPVYQPTSYTGLIYDRETTLAAACSNLTEDHKVFAATVYDSFTSLVNCLAKHGTPSISMPSFVLDQANQDTFADFYYSVSGMNLTRGDDVMVDRLHGTGWLTKSTKTGILFQTQDPQYERGAQRLASRIRALGASAPVTVGIESTASISNAIVSFRQAGVDHVLFSDLGGGLVYAFMTAAEGQAYRPLYGLNSNEQLGTQAQLAPAPQLANVTGISWLIYDVGPSHDLPSSPNKKLCLKIYASAGIDTTDRTTQDSAVTYCDLFLFIDAATKKAPELSVKGFRAGVEALGSSYASAASFTSRFGPTRHDGPSSTRIVVFDNNCTCFAYGPGGAVPTG